MWKLRRSLRGLRAWQFVSHKFLRWLTLIPLLLLLVSSAALAANPAFRLLLALQLLLYLLAFVGLLSTLAGRRTNQAVSAPFFILLGSAAALVGLAEACLGRRFGVWDIPALSRGTGPPHPQRSLTLAAPIEPQIEPRTPGPEPRA
jgi:hypothetical protein